MLTHENATVMAFIIFFFVVSKGHCSQAASSNSSGFADDTYDDHFIGLPQHEMTSPDGIMQILGLQASTPEVINPGNDAGESTIMLAQWEADKMAEKLVEKEGQ